MLLRTVGLRALCAAACIAVLPASSASAVTKSKLPRISSVAPMKLGVGDVLTIRGTNFRPGNARNSVIFKRDGARAVFVKAGKATRTRIYVRVPASLASYLPSVKGKPAAARFRLRVLAANFSRSYTALAKSPTIAPAGLPPATQSGTPGAPAAAPLAPAAAPAALTPPPDCDGDGTPDDADGDDDNDLLTDALEAAIRTDRCKADTDGDGVTDAFEYQSAIDLNSTGGSLPYPGKRPYPNPLFADEQTDYDGDGLSASQEQTLWRHVGPLALPLSYSAGLKRSVAGPTDDDYRDADVDGLGNWDEFNGPMQPGWWEAYYKEVPYDQPYAGTSAVDADSDGDGLIDGPDDVDHDGWSNADEVVRGPYRVQPFNPCLPDYESPTCSNHPPIENPYPPFDKPRPATPIVWAPPPTI